MSPTLIGVHGIHRRRPRHRRHQYPGHQVNDFQNHHPQKQTDTLCLRMQCHTIRRSVNSDNAQRKPSATADKQRQFRQGTAKTLCDRRRKPLPPRAHDWRLSKSQKGFHRHRQATDVVVHPKACLADTAKAARICQAAVHTCWFA